jgi:hypothetical protein
MKQKVATNDLKGGNKYVKRWQQMFNKSLFWLNKTQTWLNKSAF